MASQAVRGSEATVMSESNLVRPPYSIELTGELEVEGDLLLHVNLENGYSGEGINFSIIQIEPRVIVSNFRVDCWGVNETRLLSYTWDAQRKEILTNCFEHLHNAFHSMNCTAQHRLLLALLSSNLCSLLGANPIKFGLADHDLLDLDTLVGGGHVLEESYLDRMQIQSYFSPVDLASSTVDLELLANINSDSALRASILRQISH